MSVESIKYDDICDKCAHAGYCDMATFGGHNPKITACYKFEKRHQTNADLIRQMSDAGIEDWYWWMHKEMMRYTDSRIFVHDWLKSPVEPGEADE